MQIFSFSLTVKIIEIEKFRQTFQSHGTELDEESQTNVQETLEPAPESEVEKLKVISESSKVQKGNKFVSIQSGKAEYT